MSSTIDGWIFATHTFLVMGGDTGLTPGEALERVQAEHGAAGLYCVYSSGALPGGVGVVMVRVSARVALLPVGDAVDFVRGVAVSRFPGTERHRWGVVDSRNVGLCG